MTPSSASYLPGTPGGQPMTPGNVGLDIMSPTIGQKLSFAYLQIFYQSGVYISFFVRLIYFIISCLKVFLFFPSYFI